MFTSDEPAAIRHAKRLGKTLSRHSALQSMNRATMSSNDGKSIGVCPPG